MLRIEQGLMKGGGLMVNKIGSRIKFLRKKHKLTMSEFANLIEVSAGNVGDWESAKKKTVPSAKALIKIAQEFNVSLDWLMTGKEAATDVLGDENKFSFLSEQCVLNSHLEQLTEEDKKFLEEFFLLYIKHRKIEKNRE